MAFSLPNAPTTDLPQTFRCDESASVLLIVSNAAVLIAPGTGRHGAYTLGPEEFYPPGGYGLPASDAVQFRSATPGQPAQLSLVGRRADEGAYTAPAPATAITVAPGGGVTPITPPPAQVTVVSGIAASGSVSVAGSVPVAVSLPAITATSVILLTPAGNTGTVGAVYVSSVTPGTGFQITKPGNITTTIYWAVI